MSNGLPRSQLRERWAVPEHLSALDDDVDKLQAAMAEGFDKMVIQLEKNRKTWQWAAGIILAFSTLIVGIISVALNA